MAVKLGQYKGIRAYKEKIDYNEYEPENFFQKNILGKADWTRVERPAQMGDRANIDFKGFVDGEAFEGGSAEHFVIMLGSHMFIPGFEEQMVGHDAGEEFDVNVEFPANYPMESLAGKPAVFKVLIHFLDEAPVVEYSDETVKKYFDCETKEQFEEQYVKPAFYAKRAQVENDWAEIILKVVVDSSEIELDTLLLENEITTLFNRQKSELADQYDMFLKYYQMTEENFRETFREEATLNLKVSAVIEAIAKEEKMTVSETEVEAELKKIAEQYHADLEEVRKLCDGEVRANMLTEKVFQLILGTAEEG